MIFTLRLHTTYLAEIDSPSVAHALASSELVQAADRYPAGLELVCLASGDVVAMTVRHGNRSGWVLAEFEQRLFEALEESSPCLVVDEAHAAKVARASRAA